VKFSSGYKVYHKVSSNEHRISELTHAKEWNEIRKLLYNAIVKYTRLSHLVLTLADYAHSVVLVSSSYMTSLNSQVALLDEVPEMIVTLCLLTLGSVPYVVHTSTVSTMRFYCLSSIPTQTSCQTSELETEADSKRVVVIQAYLLILSKLILSESSSSLFEKHQPEISSIYLLQQRTSGSDP
jgi:hypothetical protein